MKSTYGYSTNTGVDEDGFRHRQTVTPGNAHDTTQRDTLLLRIPRRATRGKLERFDINDQVQRKGYRGHPFSDADRLRNDAIAVTLSGGERPFAIYKFRYGVARTRLMGLTKNLALFGMVAIADNIAKCSKFLTLYGIPSPDPTR